MDPVSIPMKTAIREGNLDEVSHLLSSSSIRHWPKWSNSLLIQALEGGHEHVARYLIAKRAAVCHEETYDCTSARVGDHLCREASALHHAVSHGYTDVVEMLLDRGADVDARNEAGQTPLHLAVMVDFPDDYRAVAIIQSLVNRGASVNALNLDGRTPLHEACRRNSLEVVTTLVALRANIHTEVSPKIATSPLFTPLHFAVSSGSVDIARYLVRKGAHIVKKDNVSPLYLAVQRADLSMINKLMIARFACLPVLLNLSILSGNSRNALRILTYILGIGAEINPTEGLQPLHLAAAAGKDSVCEYLLQYGADIEAKQTLKEDQVHEESRLLCNYDLDLKSLRLDGLGKTALHFATENNREAVVELLLRHGADVDATDEHGQTALHVACRMQPVPVPVVEYLLIHGSDVNIVDLRGQTVLDVVSAYIFQPPRILRDAVSCHLVKLIAAGFYVDKRLSALIPSPHSFAPARWPLGNPRLSADFSDMCEKEIAELRSEEIAGIKFYKILHKSLNEIAVFSKYKGVAEVFKSGELKRRFPIYGNMLKAGFVRGESRAKLLDEVPISFHENQGFCLPYLCVEKILDYLNDSDLKRLNDACKCPSFRRVP